MFEQILSLYYLICPDECLTVNSDTRDFLIERWNTAVEIHRLEEGELQEADNVVTQESFNIYVKTTQQEARRNGQTWKIMPLQTVLTYDRVLWTFESVLKDVVITEVEGGDALDVKHVDTSTLWLMSYLNVKVW